MVHLCEPFKRATDRKSDIT